MFYPGSAIGFYVVPSDALTTTPTLITGSYLGQYIVLFTPTQNDGAGNLSSFIPSGVLFSTHPSGGTNGNFFYTSLNSSSMPSAVQLTNLSSNDSCPVGNSVNGIFPLAELANLTDGSSGFAVVEMAGPDNQCRTADDQYFLIPANATASSSPTALPITGAYTFQASFYSSPGGVLTGIVADDGQGNLKLFTDQTLSSSSVLLPATAGYTTTYTDILNSPGYTFIAATSTATGAAASTSVSKLYRVDRSGAISGPLYTSQTGGTLAFGANDSNNFIFTDSVYFNAYSPGPATVVQVADSGASPALILYASPIVSSSSSVMVEIQQVVASTGTEVILDGYQSSNGGPVTLGLYSVPVGSTSTQPNQIASWPDGYFFASILENSLLFISTESYGSSNTFIPSSSVLQTNGTVVNSLPNSQLAGFGEDTQIDLSTGYLSYPLYNLIVAQGITATDASFGGATLYNFNISGTEAPLQLPNGQNVTVPNGYISFSTFPYTPNIGIQTTSPSTVSGASTTYVFDLSKNLIVQLPY